MFKLFLTAVRTCLDGKKLYRTTYGQGILEDINIGDSTGWCCADGSKERSSGKRLEEFHDGKEK